MGEFFKKLLNKNNTTNVDESRRTNTSNPDEQKRSAAQNDLMRHTTMQAEKTQLKKE